MLHKQFVIIFSARNENKYALGIVNNMYKYKIKELF